MVAALYPVRGLTAIVVPALVLVALVLPVMAGLGQTTLAAFGWLPALGARDPGLAAWRSLAEIPGLGGAVRLSLFTGGLATAASVGLALEVLALFPMAGAHSRGLRLLAPFLAVPHAAMAIGLAFVLAPSGWIARALAPLAGWQVPPDIATLGDPWGLALVLGLMVKEVPFLLLVSLAALGQIPVQMQMNTARTLGYAPALAWVAVILPQLWPRIRLPVLAVLAYSLSVVDMALILGPSNPPTLAVVLTRLFTDPDPARFLPGAAGALVQLALVAGAFGLLLVLEGLARIAGRAWLRRGRRGGAAGVVARLAGGGVMGLALLATLAMSALLIWSLAWTWRFPALLPVEWSLRAWSGPSRGWGDALGQTLLLAGASTALALGLAVTWLEAEDRAGRRFLSLQALVLVPLLVPQLAILFGLNVTFLRMGLHGGYAAVIWAQMVFVFPYVLLALADPWRGMDPRLVRTAASLGASPLARLVRVKLPVMLAPLATATAIGVGVSVAQYLPTLFMGAGRIATLTTEAVTLSSASDRRVVGVYASLQALVPLIAYGLAALLPAMIRRRRFSSLQKGPA